MTYRVIGCFVRFNPIWLVFHRLWFPHATLSITSRAYDSHHLSIHRGTNLSAATTCPASHGRHCSSLSTLTRQRCLADNESIHDNGRQSRVLAILLASNIRRLEYRPNGHYIVICRAFPAIRIYHHIHRFAHKCPFFPIRSAPGKAKVKSMRYAIAYSRLNSLSNCDASSVMIA